LPRNSDPSCAAFSFTENKQLLHVKFCHCLAVAEYLDAYHSIDASVEMLMRDNPPHTTTTADDDDDDDEDDDYYEDDDDYEDEDDVADDGDDDTYIYDDNDDDRSEEEEDESILDDDVDTAVNQEQYEDQGMFTV